MAADLRLVVHAAEAHAHELTAHRLRNGAGNGRFADARRAHEAQDLPLRVVREALHGKALRDALLDPVHAVVVAVEHGAGMDKVQIVLRFLRPRQVEDELDIRLRHGRFVRAVGQLGKAVDLLIERGAHRVGHGLLRRALPVGGDLVALLPADLLADGLELLAQDKFLLIVLERGFHLFGDALVDLEDLDLAADEPQHAERAGLHVVFLQQGLLILQLRCGGLPDRVHEPRQLRDLQNGLPLLRGEPPALFGIRSERLAELAAQRLRGHGVRLGLRQVIHRRGEVRVGRDHLADGRAGYAGDEQVHRIALDAEYLPDAADRADAVDVLLADLHERGVLLRNEQRHAAVADRRFHGGERLDAADVAMHDLARHDRKPAQRDHRQGGRVNGFHLFHLRRGRVDRLPVARVLSGRAAPPRRAQGERAKPYYIVYRIRFFCATAKNPCPAARV